MFDASGQYKIRHGDEEIRREQARSLLLFWTFSRHPPPFCIASCSFARRGDVMELSELRQPSLETPFSLFVNYVKIA